MSLVGPSQPNVTCHSQIVDGTLRGIATGAMWGLAVAPLGIARDALTLSSTSRMMTQNATTFGNKYHFYWHANRPNQHSVVLGAFLSVYTGVRCTLDPLLDRHKVLNAFFSGSTAGFVASMIDTRCVKASCTNGALAGVCTASIAYLMSKSEQHHGE